MGEATALIPTEARHAVHLMAGIEEHLAAGDRIIEIPRDQLLDLGGLESRGE
jgi:hypothetical protein